MIVSSKLIDKPDNLHAWEPKTSLKQVELTELQYSTGFLQADLTSFFSNFSDRWLLLLHSFQIPLKEISIVKELMFPPELSRIVPIEISGEAAVMGMDDRSQKIITDFFNPNTGSNPEANRGMFGESAGDLVCEYFERRLLSSLNSSWAGPEELKMAYVSTESDTAVEVIGAIKLSIFDSQNNIDVWFGLGVKALERIDSLWRSEVRSSRNLGNQEINLSGPVIISVELAELTVEPSSLIDYMRSGSVIELDLPVSNEVDILANNSPWAKGELQLVEGNVAVKITDLQGDELSHPDSDTRVQLQVAEHELEVETFLELNQVGAMFPIETQAVAPVSIVISGEQVARASLAQLDGKFVLQVLDK